MNFSYKTKDTCSRAITFDITDEGIIENVSFQGGCNGNLKAISMLVNGKNAKEVAAMLRGNTCGPRQTSCADQLAKAIEAALSEMGK